MWGPIPFRFENTWLKAVGFKEIINVWWPDLHIQGSTGYKLMIEL